MKYNSIPIKTNRNKLLSINDLYLLLSNEKNV